MSDPAIEQPPVARFWVWLLVIVFGAVVLRIAYILTFSSHLAFGPDTIWFQLEAGGIALGHGFVDPGRLYSSGLAVPTAFRPPLYPGFLAVVIELIGDSRQTLQLAGAITGGASVVLIGLLGRRVAGARVGLVAAALAAVSPALLGFDASLMSESIYIPIVAGLLLLVYSAVDRPTAARWAIVGSICGFGMLTRGDAVVLFGVVVLPAVLLLRIPWRSKGALVLASVIGMAIVVGPWIVRNQVQLGQPTLATLSAGTTLAGTNCDAAYHGLKLGSWEYECTVRRTDGRRSEIARNDALESAGLAYARDHAGRLPIVMAVRVLRLWGAWDPVEEARLESGESRNLTWQLVTWGAYLATAVLAIVGFVILRRRQVRWEPLAAVVASVTIAAALSYGAQRFRAAAEPVLLVGAAVTVEAAIRRVRPVRTWKFGVPARAGARGSGDAA